MRDEKNFDDGVGFFIFVRKKMDFGFEELVVWQRSRVMVKRVYEISSTFPQEEKFTLVSQLRRAAVSVVSNIAEGSGRISRKEKIHFCEIAYGSLMEVLCQLIVAYDLGFISDQSIASIRPLVNEIARLLSGYRRSFTSPPSPSKL